MPTIYIPQKTFEKLKRWGIAFERQYSAIDRLLSAAEAAVAAGVFEKPDNIYTREAREAREETEDGTARGNAA